MTIELIGMWEGELEKLEAERRQVWSSQRYEDPTTMMQRWNRMLELQRKICAAHKEEFAERIELDIITGFDWYAVVGWSTATLLVELYKPVDKHSCAAITFERNYGSRMEKLNDEVFEAHPLYGKGLDLCGAFIIHNSTWKTAMQKCQSYHEQYDEKLWADLKHFLFRDKEGDFHSLAAGFKVKTLEMDIARLRELVAFWK